MTCEGDEKGKLQFNKDCIKQAKLLLEHDRERAIANNTFIPHEWNDLNSYDRIKYIDQARVLIMEEHHKNHSADDYDAEHDIKKWSEEFGKEILNNYPNLGTVRTPYPSPLVFQNPSKNNTIKKKDTWYFILGIVSIWVIITLILVFLGTCFWAAKSFLKFIGIW